MYRPIKSRHAVAALYAVVLEHDVITRLGIVVGVVAIAIQYIVADDGRIEEQFGVVARQRVEAAATLDPVVALVAHQKVDAVSSQNEIVVAAAQYVLAIGPGNDEVLPFVPENKGHA